MSFLKRKHEARTQAENITDFLLPCANALFAAPSRLHRRSANFAAYIGGETGTVSITSPFVDSFPPLREGLGKTL